MNEIWNKCPFPCSATREMTFGRATIIAVQQVDPATKTQSLQVPVTQTGNEHPAYVWLYS